jgi:hypothetical protein
MAFLIPLQIIIPIALVVVILVVVMWYIYTKNKKMAGKLISERRRFKRYKKGVEFLKLHPKNPQKDFKILNKYVRAFFKEYLELGYNLTYLELSKKFTNQKKPEYSKFSKLMSDINYKDEKKTKEDVKKLIDLFSKILNSY